MGKDYVGKSVAGVARKRKYFYTVSMSHTTIGFQGVMGAYSQLAALAYAPDCSPVPYPTVSAALDALQAGAIECALLPVENTTAGRVGMMHDRMPDLKEGLYIVDEYWYAVRHQLLVHPRYLAACGSVDTALARLTTVRSHIQALGQCKESIGKLTPHAVPEEYYDTAGSAEWLAGTAGDAPVAVIASRAAGELYGLTVLVADIQDRADNLTRFVAVSRTPRSRESATDDMITTLIMQLPNVPNSLARALSALSGNNLVKIESYLYPPWALQCNFLIELEGDADVEPLRSGLARLTELGGIVHVLGVYPAGQVRRGHTR